MSETIRVKDSTAFLAAAEKAGFKVTWNDGRPTSAVKVTEPIKTTETRGAAQQTTYYPVGSTVGTTKSDEKPKLSGYNIAGIPVSEAVAEKVIAEQPQRSNLLTPENLRPSNRILTSPIINESDRFAGLTHLNRSSSFTGLESFTSNTNITPQSVGADRYRRIEKQRQDPAYQFAFFAGKTLSLETVFAVAGGLPSLWSEEYKKPIREKWAEEQKQEQYRMSMGESLVVEKGVPAIVSGASMIIGGIVSIPAKLSTAFVAPKMVAFGAAHPTLTKGIGYAFTGGGAVITGLGTSEVAKNWYDASIGKIDATMAVGRGIFGMGVGASLTRSGWKMITTPRVTAKKTQIDKIEYKYQSTVGGKTKINQKYPVSDVQKETIYGDPNIKDFKITKPDKIIYAEIKGYRQAKIIPTGETKQFPFTDKIKFRIDEQAGVLKPLHNQYISEVDIWKHASDPGSTFSLGTRHLDVGHAMSFDKTGTHFVVNTENWEKGFVSIKNTIPVDTTIIKYSLWNQNPVGTYQGHSYTKFEKDMLLKMLGQTSGDKVVTSVDYTSFNVEPEPLIKNVVIPADASKWKAFRAMSDASQAKIEGDIIKNIWTPGKHTSAGTGVVSVSDLSSPTHAFEKLTLQPVYNVVKIPSTGTVEGYVVTGFDLKSPLLFAPSMSTSTVLKNIVLPKNTFNLKTNTRTSLSVDKSARSRLQPAMSTSIQPAISTSLQPGISTSLQPAMTTSLQPALEPSLSTQTAMTPGLKPNIVPPPIAPIGFIPDMGRGFGRRTGGKKTKRGKKKLKYQPSFGGILLGKIVKKPLKGSFTGAEIRPMVKRKAKRIFKGFTFKLKGK